MNVSTKFNSKFYSFVNFLTKFNSKFYSFVIFLTKFNSKIYSFVIFFDKIQLKNLFKMLKLAVFNSIKYSCDKKTWVSNRARHNVQLLLYYCVTGEKPWWGPSLVPVFPGLPLALIVVRLCPVQHTQYPRKSSSP